MKDVEQGEDYNDNNEDDATKDKEEEQTDNEMNELPEEEEPKDVEETKLKGDYVTSTKVLKEDHETKVSHENEEKS